MSRRRIDLKQRPLWQQYLIAIVVAAGVFALAWRVGRNRPSPLWIKILIPVWKWVGVAVLFFFIARWLFMKLRNIGK
jgi:hypothetical protein